MRTCAQCSRPPRDIASAGDAITQLSATVVEDAWQNRLDRMRRLLPVPLLLVSTAGAVASQDVGRFAIGVPVASAAAVLWTVVTLRPTLTTSPRARLVVFAVHTALAGVLVWVSAAYGIFAYTGFLYAYGLGHRWRTAAFAVTALIVSAALVGGYPTGRAGQTIGFLVVAAVMLALVLNSAIVTVRAVEQNQERGRMLAELAQANQRLEAALAENAGLHARLLDQAREAGVLDERQRLAGEIHDTLAQGLTGIVAQLEAAEQTRHRPDEWSRHLVQARSLARSSLTEARRSVRALRPEQLEQASLPDAIGALIRSWRQQVGIPADLDTIGEPMHAGDDTEAALFRMVQEALANVAKHAGASRVRLTLTYLDDTLLLDVADDGSGFDPAATTDGYGLLAMAQRLGRVGGTMTVESTRGAGTTVNATLPLGRGM